MRLTSRFLGLAFVTLLAFWFVAENAGETVLVDLVFVRLRVSLPLLVFGSVLGGMGISLVTGWRADQRALRRTGAAGDVSLPPGHHDRIAATYESGELEPRGDQTEWH